MEHRPDLLANWTEIFPAEIIEVELVDQVLYMARISGCRKSGRGVRGSYNKHHGGNNGADVRTGEVKVVGFDLDDCPGKPNDTLAQLVQSVCAFEKRVTGQNIQ